MSNNRKRRTYTRLCRYYWRCALLGDTTEPHALIKAFEQHPDRRPWTVR